MQTHNRPNNYGIYSAPFDSHVLVYHPELDRWDGPTALLNIEGETCTVWPVPPSGLTKVRTTVVKRFIMDDTENKTETSLTTENRTATNFSGATLTVQINNNAHDDYINNKDLQEIIIIADKLIPQSKDYKKNTPPHVWRK